MLFNFLLSKFWVIFFDSLRLLRLVTSKCCILNLWSVLSWFHTLDLYSSATGTTSCAGCTILIPGPKFCCGRWVWLIFSGGLILKCDFCMYFLLNLPFYGWYDWLCRSYPYYIVFSVEVWNVLVYPKLVNDQYDYLHWSYCYLLVYYLLLAVLAFYSVFVTIYTTSSAGSYLSFPLTLWVLASHLASLLCLRSFRLVALVGLTFWLHVVCCLYL